MPDGIFLPVLKIRGMSLARLTHLVHQYGGILGPAHPFGTRYNSALLLRKIRKNPHLVAHFDFIEGFNTCESPEANLKALSHLAAQSAPCSQNIKKDTPWRPPLDSVHTTEASACCILRTDS